MTCTNPQLPRPKSKSVDKDGYKRFSGDSAYPLLIISMQLEKKYYFPYGKMALSDGNGRDLSYCATATTHDHAYLGRGGALPAAL
ncbi:hypothetical protein chiPu_0012350 [Chiloscyllium punctatum]|uniref:Uncharacterized protein n=1 Tax=Chiloscyllium punctatum TaxID=137246 RepID=A0A401SU07_CHIPU|nr:hypothetical protein [Chiloscyllium punctatum]